jgi:serine/threonine protein phosphatase 1
MFNIPPTLPDGLRIYAIGDIHGRFDLLKQLLEKITADKKTPGIVTKKIFLGDYIDRGLQSKQVFECLMSLFELDDEKPVFLLGNHEQVMRQLLHAYDLNLMNDWLKFGGRETLMSYGIRPSAFSGLGDLAKIMTDFVNKVPDAHNHFLKSLITSVNFGDYFFCHAGARPGIELEAQTENDLVWIRRDFMSYEGKFSKMIVHGHTIRENVEFMPNRINVDTGAYATGCLTALALEGNKQWIIQTNT